MASFRKRGNAWRAEIFIDGMRSSASFSTKREAQAWAAEEESKLRQEKADGIPDKHFGDLLQRYVEQVTPTKLSVKRETVMIRRLQRDPLSKVHLRELKPSHFSDWRERRLEEVSPATVIREMVLMSHACNVARKEWGWLHSNPVSDVRRPPTPKSRTRRPTPDEIEVLLIALGYDRHISPTTTTARVGAAFLFACETAMRAGEICALTWDNVHEKHVHLPKTKNGYARDVPLSGEAHRLLDQLKSVTNDDNHVFKLSSPILDSLFRKAKARAGIEDLHFHDSRREALTRLSKIFNVMELARISGHRDLRILQNVYYAPKVEDLADKLKSR